MKKLSVLMAGLISAVGIFVTFEPSAEASEFRAVDAFKSKLQPLIAPQSIGEGIKAGAKLLFSILKNDEAQATYPLIGADMVLNEAETRFNDWAVSFGNVSQEELAQKISTALDLIKKKRDIIDKQKTDLFSTQEAEQRHIKMKDLRDNDCITPILKDTIALGDQICDLFK